MLGLRFQSPAVRVIASAIGVVCLFPWIVLGMQAMGLIFRYASFGQWSVTTSLVVGAHADDEYCLVDEVRLAARTYASLALDWCGTRTHSEGAQS